uniref:Exocyst complex component Sec8 n=1 Tax=Macrostomum lignano TaxID=282301 RepID=A0A1I8FF85_9PLAT
MMPCAGQDPLRLVLPRARAPLLQSCVNLADTAERMPGQADGAACIGGTGTLLQQFGRACQSALSRLTRTQAVHRRVQGPPAAAVRPRLLCHGRLDCGARMPRDVRELSDIGKVAQLATLSESLSWLVTIAGRPLFGDSPVERKVTEQLDHLKVLSGKCFNVIMIEVCLRASNRLKDLPTHSNFSVGVDDIELDDRVTAFLSDLRCLKRRLRRLRSRVFRLLPGVVCALLAALLPSFSRINPLGVKKIGRNLFEMQRPLTWPAGAREAEFARVRELFDLLLLTPDQIVASVLEQGPRFSLEEYDSVLRVYARTYSSCDEEKMRRARERLRQVITQKHV